MVIGMPMLKSLQAGRAIAALAVLAFHLRGSALMRGHSWLANMSNHGNLGVDFFFVLSGFIILYAHKKDIGKSDQFLSYLSRRFQRVYPIYWLFTALFVISLAIFGGTTSIPASGAGWFSTLTLIRISDIIPPLSVAWTLFYEIAFYAMFGILILSRSVGVAVFLAWILLIFAFHTYAPTNSPAGVWTSFIGINFLIGMGSCLIHTRLSNRASLIVLALGILVLIGTGSFIDKILPLWVCQPLVALSCGAIICGFTSIETRRALNFGVLGLIGDASYTVYLVHQRIIQVVLRTVRKLGLFAVLSPDAIFLLAITLTIAASVIIYFLTEKQMVALFKWLRQYRRRAMVVVPAS